MNRDSFIFYRSFYEAILELPENDQKDVLLAIANYSLNFQEPKLTGLSNAVWILIKPQLDANIQRYKNGKKGGRKTETKPKPNQTETKPKANKNENVNVNKNDKDSIRNKIISWSNEKQLDITKVLNTFERAWEYYEDMEWKDRNNKPVKNRYAKIKNVWYKDLENFKHKVEIPMDVLNLVINIPEERKRLAEKYGVTEEYLINLKK